MAAHPEFKWAAHLQWHYRTDDELGVEQGVDNQRQEGGATPATHN